MLLACSSGEHPSTTADDDKDEVVVDEPDEFDEVESDVDEAAEVDNWPPVLARWIVIASMLAVDEAADDDDADDERGRIEK